MTGIVGPQKVTSLFLLWVCTLKKSKGRGLLDPVKVLNTKFKGSMFISRGQI